jgi:hypothetical protein
MRTEHERSTYPLDAPYARTNGSRSLAELITALTRELSDLFVTEVRLARTEMSMKIDQATSGAVTVIAGTVVLFAGLLGLLTAATIGLNAYVVHEWWLSATIVGGALTLVGLVVVMSGRRKMKARNLVPRRTVRNLREDAELLRDDAARSA